MKFRLCLCVSGPTRARRFRKMMLAAVAAGISGSCNDAVAPDPAAALVWTDVRSGNSPTLFDINGTGAANIWAVGNDAILHHDGTSWSVAASGINQNLTAVWPTTATDVWAVGSGGAIRHYDGTAWVNVASGTTSMLADVW